MLKLDVDLIKKITQRDVNNHVIQYEDGSIKAKGRTVVECFKRNELYWFQMTPKYGN